FVLGRRPSPSLPLGLTRTALHSQLGAVSLEAPLDAILGGTLDGLDRSRFISVVAANDGHLAPMADRSEGRVARSRDATAGPPTLVLQAGRLRGLPLVLTPDTSVRPPAAALMASGVVRPVMMAGRLTQLVGDDIVVPGDGLQNGGGG